MFGFVGSRVDPEEIDDSWFRGDVGRVLLRFYIGLGMRLGKGCKTALGLSAVVLIFRKSMVLGIGRRRPCFAYDFIWLSCAFGQGLHNASVHT